MTYEEYVTAQRLIVLRLVAQLVVFLNPFRARYLSPSAWVGLLAGMYETITRSRRESARLARQFYDAERERQVGRGRRHDLFLAEYDTDWFLDAMEPARLAFSQAEASQEAMNAVIGQAVKIVENGGRTTILRGIETDPRGPRYARVQGGDESCAWCLMLISRGPVYESRESAGEGAFWHPNCDCKVVPVFDKSNWSGRTAWLAAEEIWKRAEGRNSAEKVKWIRRYLNGRELDSVLPIAA